MKSLKDFISENALNEAMTYEEFDIDKLTQLILEGLEEQPRLYDIRKEEGLSRSLWILLNYTDKKDWPHGIERNANRFWFRMFFSDCKLGLTETPHIYLSPYDKEHDYKYFAMRNVKDMCKTVGIKWRDGKVKDEADIAKKICKYVNDAVKVMKVYTNDEYPWHHGKIETSLKDAYKNR